MGTSHSGRICPSSRCPHQSIETPEAKDEGALRRRQPSSFVVRPSSFIAPQALPPVHALRSIMYPVRTRPALFSCESKLVSSSSDIDDRS